MTFWKTNPEISERKQPLQERILFVDDDAQILAALKFSLGQKFNLVTEDEPEAGLKTLGEAGPFAVVVSDLEMPGMTGAEFLEAVKARAPESVRLMLTSKADLESAMLVVNQANIFRFLTKPCPTLVITKCLDDALHQYRLVMAEKELLEKTLRGSIRVMTEILSMADPSTFDQAVALHENVRALAVALGADNIWQLEVAAMLAQIGRVTMPTYLINKPRGGSDLREVAQSMVQRVPQIGSNLLVNIPRLEQVAEIVLYQNKNFDGSGFPQDKTAGEGLPLGSRILKVLIDLADLEGSGKSLEKAFEIMRERQGSYDLRVLETAFSSFVKKGLIAPAAIKYTYPVKVNELCLGQILLANVETSDGILLVAAGREVTESILEKISNFAEFSSVREPILVESVHPKGAM